MTNNEQSTQAQQKPRSSNELNANCADEPHGHTPMTKPQGHFRIGIDNLGGLPPTAGRHQKHDRIQNFAQQHSLNKPTLGKNKK